MDSERDDSVKRFALIMAALASFLTPFIGSSVNIALPSIAEEFEIDAIILGWIPTSYLLTSAILLLPFGRVADIFGRKIIFTYGILIYTVASLFCGLSTSGTTLIVFRIFQGVGSAMIFGNAVAILTSVFPPEERGKALGINIAGISLGLTLGPFLGGVMTHYIGWRSIFLFNVPIGIIIIAAILKVKGEWAEARGEKFDLTGTFLFSTSLILLIYGFSSLPERFALLLSASGLLLLILFVAFERKTEQPILNIEIFKNRTFAVNNLAALTSYMPSISVVFLMSLYLQYIMGLNPSESGAILLSLPLFITIFSPVAGKLSDVVEERFISSSGLVLMSVSLFLLSGKDLVVLQIAAILSALGIGMAFFAAPNTKIVMGAVGSRFYGVASATLSTMRVLGQMLGMGVAMLFISISVGKTQLNPSNYAQFTKSIELTFTLFAIFCLIGAVASILKFHDL
jgi:EmrB/QacA subfamily drug resistance transporter